MLYFKPSKMKRVLAFRDGDFLNKSNKFLSSDVDDILMLVILWSLQDIGDEIIIMMILSARKSVTNISKLSSINFVSNIRRQHWRNSFLGIQKVKSNSEWNQDKGKIRLRWNYSGVTKIGGEFSFKWRKDECLVRVKVNSGWNEGLEGEIEGKSLLKKVILALFLSDPPAPG